MQVPQEVLAARLIEDADVTVALIEAGDGDNALEIDVPTFPHLFKTQFDWDFASEPEPALKQRRIYLPRGKVPEAHRRSMRWFIFAAIRKIMTIGCQGATGWSLYGSCHISSIRKQMSPAAISTTEGPLHVSDSRRCILG